MARKAKTREQYRDEASTLRRQVAALEERMKDNEVDRAERNTFEAKWSAAEKRAVRLEDELKTAHESHQVTLTELIDTRKALEEANSDRQRLTSSLQAREAAYDRADRRAGENQSARQSLLEAFQHLGQGLGEK